MGLVITMRIYHSKRKITIKMTNNGYTQKELLNMVIERLDRLEEKLDAKLDKAEFYKVLTLP